MSYPNCTLLVFLMSFLTQFSPAAVKLSPFLIYITDLLTQLKCLPFFPSLCSLAQWDFPWKLSSTSRILCIFYSPSLLVAWIYNTFCFFILSFFFHSIEDYLTKALLSIYLIFLLVCLLLLLRRSLGPHWATTPEELKHP